LDDVGISGGRGGMEKLFFYLFFIEEPETRDIFVYMNNVDAWNFLF